jgi:hypothetical protein
VSAFVEQLIAVGAFMPMEFSISFPVFAYLVSRCASAHGKNEKNKILPKRLLGFWEVFNLTTGIQKPFQEYFLFYSSD